jgi:PAS domain S-box-containing protein
VQNAFMRIVHLIKVFGMNQLADFFQKLFDSSDWPPRWHCGKWTEFHGWLYIVSDLLIWSAYFAIPVVIINYISKKKDAKFLKLYFLFAAFILACGATHFLDAVAFWIPAYRLSALVRLITGILSWITVFHLVKLLPVAFSLKSQQELEKEIAQRKKAEEQARESEEQIQTVFRAAPDAVIAIDEEGTIIKWNPKAEILFGWAAVEAIGKPLSETIIPHRYREAHKNGLNRFLATGEASVIGKTIEIKALNKNNAEFDVALSVSPTLVDNKPLFIGFVRDITEQKKKEKEIRQLNETLEKRVIERTAALQSSEKQYRYLFVNNPMPMWIIDINSFRFLDVNEAAVMHYGYSREEFLSMTALDIRPNAEKEKYKQADHASAIGSEYHRGVWKHLKKDGTLIYAEIIAHDIIFEGEKSRFILSNDITARVKSEAKLIASEERFRSIIEQFPYPVINYEPDGSYISANQAWEIMWQDKRENVQNYNIRRDTQLVQAGLSHYVEKAFNGETAISEPYLYDPALIGQKGRKRWMVMTLYPLKNQRSEILEVILILQDITESKEAEKKLLATLKEVSDYKYALDESSIVAITDQKGIIKHVNENFCKISKYSPEELIGQDHRIINSGYHDKAFIRDLWVTIAKGKIWKGQLRNKAKDGSIYWVDTTIVPFLNEQGKPYQYVAVRSDITARKLTEQALRENQQLLQAIVNNSTTVIYVKDLQGQYLMANNRFTELFHLSEQEILGKTDYDIFPKEAADAFRAMDVRVAGSKHALTEQETAPQDDGLHTYISVKSTLKDATGRPYAIFGISTDITDYKTAEENLSKSLKETSDYKYALDESAIVAITDQKGIIKHVNQKFCKISKYSAEELLGRDHRIVNSGYHPKEFIRNLWVTIANGNIWKGELKNKAKDGSYYWVDTTIIPFLNENGKPYQYVAIRADITERKAVEENLRNSLKETSDYKYALDESSIVAITDQKGIIKHVNENFCKISKYSAAELIGQDHRIINSGYHPKEFIRNLWVTIANGKIWKGELMNKAKDGTYYWVDTTIIPFLNENGKPYQYVAIRADITERKAVEENLRKSLKETSDYKYALDESAIVAITDQKGIIKHVNENFCKISKYSAAELIGQDHRIINSGYHPKEFIRNLWVTIANGKIWKGELKNKAKDGTYYWVDTTIIPFLNEQGKPYQYVAIRADITERKAVEENLRKSLKETSDYKYALDESAIVAITDQKGIIKHVNQKFCKISKYSVGELLGRDHRIINSGYHPKEFIRNLWVTIANGNIWKGELKNKAKDGSYYWVDTTIIPFLNENGKPYQYVAIRADITERKKAEEALSREKNLLRTLIDNIPDYIYVKDLELRHIINNAANVKLIGANNEEETLGKTVFDYFANEPAKHYADDDLIILNNKAPVLNKEEQIYTDTGEERWLLTTKLPLKDSNNKISGLIGISRDITEQKLAAREIYSLNNELEQRIKERTIELEAANKELEAFSYSISHDLRAPLRAVSGFSMILKEDYESNLDAEGIRIINTIIANAGRMGQLIDDLLNFSRLGRRELSYADINMNAQVQSCIKELLTTPLSDKCNISVHPLPVAKGDAAMIRQVWINLISNAIKYSSKTAKPQIEIGSSEEAGFIIYFVKDNGAGFDMKYAHKLFGVFQRLHSLEEFEGTGVGLALVNRIITKHKGRVWAEAEIGKGASFYFSLPK